LVYSSISLNFLANSSSLWDLRYTETIFSSFYEHPPFHFWLQSLFFRLVSPEYLWAEKLFSFLVFLVTNFLMVRLLMLGVGDRSQSGQKEDLSLPPMLLLLTGIFWLSNGMTEFVFSYNMLDGTLCALTTLSVYFFLKGSLANQAKLRSTFYFLGCLGVLFGFYTKGPVGFFPLVVPSLANLLLRGATKGISKDASEEAGVKEKSKGWGHSLLLFLLLGVVSVGMIGLFAALTGEGLSFLTHYFDGQVLAALEGERTTLHGKSRFFELLRILGTMNLAGLLVILLGFKFYGPRDPKKMKWSLFFFRCTDSILCPLWFFMP